MARQPNAYERWRASPPTIVTSQRLDWRERLEAHTAATTPGAHPLHTVRDMPFLESAITNRDARQFSIDEMRLSRRRAARERRRIRGLSSAAARRRRRAALRVEMADPASPLYSPGVGRRMHSRLELRAATVRLWATFQVAEAANWGERAVLMGHGRPVGGPRPGRNEHAWWTRTETAWTQVADLKQMLRRDAVVRGRLRTRGRTARRSALENGTLLSRRDRLGVRLVLARAQVRKATWTGLEGVARGAINTGKTVAAAGVMAIVRSPVAMRAIARVSSRATKASWAWGARTTQLVLLAGLIRGHQTRDTTRALLADLKTRMDAREQRLAEASATRGRERRARSAARSRARREAAADRIERRNNPYALPRALKNDAHDKVFGENTPTPMDPQNQADYSAGRAALQAAIDNNGIFPNRDGIVAVVRGQQAAGIEAGTGLGRVTAGLGPTDLAALGLARRGKALVAAPPAPAPAPTSPSASRATPGTPAPASPGSPSPAGSTPRRAATPVAGL